MPAPAAAVPQTQTFSYWMPVASPAGSANAEREGRRSRRWASIYCVLGAASFASQGPTNKKGAAAAEEGGKVKREGGMQEVRGSRIVVGAAWRTWKTF